MTIAQLCLTFRNEHDVWPTHYTSYVIENATEDDTRMTADFIRDFAHDSVREVGVYMGERKKWPDDYVPLVDLWSRQYQPEWQKLVDNRRDV